MELVLNQEPVGPIPTVDKQKYVALWATLKGSPPGAWVAIDVADCGGRHPRGKQAVLTTSARHTGIAIQTVVEGNLIYSRIRLPRSTPKPPPPAPLPTLMKPAPMPQPPHASTPAPVPASVTDSHVLSRVPQFGGTHRAVQSTRNMYDFREELDAALARLVAAHDPETWEVVALGVNPTFHQRLRDEARITAKHRCEGFTFHSDLEECDLYMRLEPAAA